MVCLCSWRGGAAQRATIRSRPATTRRPHPLIKPPLFFPIQQQSKNSPNSKKKFTLYTKMKYFTLAVSVLASKNSTERHDQNSRNIDIKGVVTAFNLLGFFLESQIQGFWNFYPKSGNREIQGFSRIGIDFLEYPRIFWNFKPCKIIVLYFSIDFNIPELRFVHWIGSPSNLPPFFSKFLILWFLQFRFEKKRYITPKILIKH